MNKLIKFQFFSQLICLIEWCEIKFYFKSHIFELQFTIKKVLLKKGRILKNFENLFYLSCDEGCFVIFFLSFFNFLFLCVCVQQKLYFNVDPVLASDTGRPGRLLSSQQNNTTFRYSSLVDGLCANLCFLIHRILELRMGINTKPNGKQKWSETAAEKWHFCWLVTRLPLN